MKYIFYLLLLLLLLPFAFAGVGDNVGVDSILLNAGLEKPFEWSTWSKSEKFNFLQSRGIYPEKRSYYQGSANLDGFFKWLGVDQPNNWYELSYEQKKEFVSRIQNPDSFVDEVKEEKTFPSIYAIISFILALLVMLASFYKVKTKFRDYVREGIYYALPLLLLILSLIYPAREFFVLLGEWAQRLLVFLLFVKPIAMISYSKFFIRAVNFRRESGIASFWFFLFHAGGLIYTRNLTLASFQISFLFWGLVAGIGMIILAATSNDESVRYINKSWKRLQYLAYPVLFAVLIHSSLWANNNLNKVFILGGVFIILKILEFSGFKLKKTKKK